ncbi:Stem-specific protein TSJT1 [Bienertia sinuspersici]
MLGVFSSSVVSPPEELVAAGSRTPSPKTKAAELVSRFLTANTSAVSAQVGDDAHLAFSHQGESFLRPRMICFFND